jgi:propane 2-monooxygenase small subunit
MTVQTKAPRSVPKPVFTDAEAGALSFPSSESRKFNYFKATRLNASLYEDVTVDVQPDPARHLTQGWVYGFARGPGGYPAEWTKIQSSDWHAFRDPNEEWEQTIYRNNANVVRQIGQNLQNARDNHAFAAWSRSWTSVVERHVGAWMHVEHGLGMHVFLPAQRDAPTNMINNAISVNSMHKLRFAQDLVLYNLELSEEVAGFDGSAHRATWMDDPSWQGVRENVERLTAVRDWAEAVFATNFVFEPIVGELFRSQFVMQAAAPNGDYVTPTLLGAGENDYERDLRYSRVLYGLFSNDPKHGDANKSLMERWLGEWLPRSLDAARRLQPVWSQPASKPVRFEESLANATQRLRGLLDELGLKVTKELQA